MSPTGDTGTEEVIPNTSEMLEYSKEIVARIVEASGEVWNVPVIREYFFSMHWIYVYLKGSKQQ